MIFGTSLSVAQKFCENGDTCKLVAKNSLKFDNLSYDIILGFSDSIIY
jgi:hypothetical protein